MINITIIQDEIKQEGFKKFGNIIVYDCLLTHNKTMYFANKFITFIQHVWYGLMALFTVLNGGSKLRIRAWSPCYSN